MKRFYIIMLVLLFACLFVSCKRTSDKDTVVIVTPAPTREATATPVPTEAAKEEMNSEEDSSGKDAEASEDIATDITYDISEISYFSDDIVRIYYPQLVHMENKLTQDKINTLISQAAMKYIEDFDTANPENTLTNDYIISWKGGRLLSIRFLGYKNDTGAAYPSSFSYSVNINLNTGDIVRLEDLFLTDDSLWKLFREKGISKYLYFDESRVLNEDPTFNQPDILSTIKDLIFRTDNISALSAADTENAGIHAYYTEDTLGLSFDTVHAVGDYIQLEISYRDLKNYIRQDSPVWADFNDESVTLKSDAPEEEKSEGGEAISIDENLIWKNINYVPGFSIIRDQSFRVNLDNKGEVYFIAGEGEGDFSLNSLYLYLADDNSNILYEFPSFYGNGSMLSEVAAVSFRDVNQDGRKDVIVIAKYMTGVGPDGAKDFPVADIYFQTEDGFVSIPELADRINSSAHNESIDSVLDYVKDLDINLDR